MGVQQTIVFDVNETLLDLQVLQGPFAQAFGHAEAVSVWFALVLHHSLVCNETKNHHDFRALGLAALDMLAQRYGIAPLAADQKQHMVGLMVRLPPHPEVHAALERLKSAGFWLATLTNGTPAAVKQQLEFAGLSALFDACLSVEAVGRYKPAPEPYLFAARSLGVKPEDMWFVAAHGWDVAGSMAVGIPSVFVARPGREQFPLAPQPQIVARDLQDAVAQILSHA